jgi:integrase
MQKIRLTKRVVDAAEVRAARYTIFDDDLKGFGLRVYPSGEKSWIVEYRPNGGGRTVDKKRLTLGPIGTLTPDMARKAAQDALARARLGADPAREKSEARKAVTFRELAEGFLREHVNVKRKAGTQRNYRQLLEQVAIPALGNLKAADVSRREVAKLHLAMQDRPYQANRLLAVIAAMYSFGGKRNMVPEHCNPARRIDKYPEHRRERFLTADEIERLGVALREAETTGLPWRVDESASNAKHVAKPDKRRTVLSPHATAAIRLLVLTGARLREILDLRWCDVDLSRGLLFLPDSKTGKKTVVLNTAALGVLDTLAVLAGADDPLALRSSTAFVITGNEPGKPRADLHKPWKSVAQRAGLEAVRLHDLRHTYASFGAGSGLGLPILGKLLGHKEAATTQRYAHLDSDPLRRAANEIGGQIAKALGVSAPS